MIKLKTSLRNFTAAIMTGNR